MVIASLTGISASSSDELPRSREQITLSFAPLVREVGPAVVNIFAKTEVAERLVSPLFNDPFFQLFFGNKFPGQNRRRQQQSLGSGVLLDPAGLIVTNHHVIANATQVKVVLSDRREFDAEILVKDKGTDLAVLRIDSGGRPLPFVEMRDSDNIEVGDLVLAIGNPFGVGQTVTSGIVSARARTAIGITDYSFFIQTDASINPGNSGGALIAMDGKLIGVNTAIFSSKKRDGGGGGSVGIGFAVPSNLVRTVLESAKGGRLVRPWIGASWQTVTPDLAEQFGLDRPGGVVLNAVYPGGPADRAGLNVGDVILAIAGRDVADSDSLRYRIATLPVGRNARTQLLRRGQTLSRDIAMREPPTEPAPDVTDITGRNPFQGARVANLSPAFAVEHGFDDMARGVIVLNVRRGSAAASIGFRKGDMVIKVNGRELATVSMLIKLVEDPRRTWKIAIKRGDQVFQSEISG